MRISMYLPHNLIEENELNSAQSIKTTAIEHRDSPGPLRLLCISSDADMAAYGRLGYAIHVSAGKVNVCVTANFRIFYRPTRAIDISTENNISFTKPRHVIQSLRGSGLDG